MEDFKGTKGKWEVSEIDIFCNDKHVAQAYSSSDRGIAEWTGKDFSEAAANATLIAAAPELLEAMYNTNQILAKLTDTNMPKYYGKLAVQYSDNIKIVNKALGKEENK